MSNFINQLYQKNKASVTAMDAPYTRLSPIAWPSEATAKVGPFCVGECSRSLFYKILGTKYSNPMTMRGSSICDLGVLLEKQQIDEYKTNSLFVEEQKRIKFIIPGQNEVEMSGKMDVVIKDEGVLKGIEIKTVTGFFADPVFGTESKIPLPKVSNLMQALLYKYYTQVINPSDDIKDVYLLYIKREDGTFIYFKIDFDEDFYPVISAISSTGYNLHTCRVQQYPSYDDFLSGKVQATEELGRIAELRINIKDIFSKTDSVYNYTNNNILPNPDYKILYSPEDIDREIQCGRIGKIKYTKMKKDSTAGDSRCKFCSYRDKCLADSGIRLK